VRKEDDRPGSGVAEESRWPGALEGTVTRVVGGVGFGRTEVCAGTWSDTGNGAPSDEACWVSPSRIEGVGSDRLDGGGNLS